jgi:hypothetical protein
VGLAWRDFRPAWGSYQSGRGRGLRGGGRARKPASAAGTLVTAFRAEAIKIVLIVVQLWLVLTMYADVIHAVFFAAFVVTVLVTQAAILIRD